MNRQCLLSWSKGLVWVIPIVLAVVPSVAVRLGGLPALAENSALARPAMRSASYTVPWDVISIGGGVSTSTHFQLQHTIGQPVIGTMTGASYTLPAGFWQLVLYNIFVPFVLR